MYATNPIHKWKQIGKLYLWRYKHALSRNYPGWHLTADKAGCENLTALLDALAQASSASNRTLAITRPTDAILSVANNRRSPTVGVDRLALSYDPNLPPDHWALTQTDATASLVIGRQSLALLRKGIADVAAGPPHGDYCIGSESQELWFWWHPAGN